MSHTSQAGAFGRPDWPLWKVIIIAPFIYGIFSLLFLIVPPVFAEYAILLALFFSLAGTVTLMWGHFSRSNWPEVLGTFIFTLQLLTFASRAWVAAIPITWVWHLPLYVVFLLAWALPLISSRFSGIVGNEINSPKTRFGRGVMALFLGLGPSAGFIGASIGIYGSRFRDGQMVWLIGAILGSFLAIVWAVHAANKLAEKFQSSNPQIMRRT